MGRHAMDIEERFWRYVGKPDARGCWNWLGSRSNGYGRMKLDGCSTGAHRFSWTVHYGPIPDGLDICHKCDNPSCVNPEHLWTGTPKDNIADMFRKGRANRSKGVRRPAAKLNDDTVRQIRKWLAEGISQRQIAKRLNISQPLVCKVNRGSIWKHV